MARTNLERAENGRVLAQLALGSEPPMHPDDFESALVDALANLMHFARREHLEFESAVGIAERHHTEEQRFGWDEVPS